MSEVIRGYFFEGFDLDTIEEGTPVQYLAAHVVRWSPDGCEHPPTIAFREVGLGQKGTILPHEDGKVGDFEPEDVENLRAAAGLLGFTPNDLSRGLDRLAAAIERVLNDGS